MLTVEQILKIMERERSCGSHDGACFGVTDPAFLRPLTRGSVLDKARPAKPGETTLRYERYQDPRTGETLYRFIKK